MCVNTVFNRGSESFLHLRGVVVSVRAADGRGGGDRAGFAAVFLGAQLFASGKQETFG